MMKKVVGLFVCVLPFLIAGCVANNPAPTPELPSSPAPEPSVTSLENSAFEATQPLSSPVPKASATNEVKLTAAATEPVSLMASEPSARNVEYLPDAHPRQVLDVYLPPGETGPFPTILAMHGGGFVTGSKSLYAAMAGYFTDKGYAMVPINYRLAPRYPYPAQVEDAFCALAWIHANAETFGFDRDRIFVMGDSAGGYLAAMLGTVETPDLYRGQCPLEIPDPSLIRGVVDFYSLNDITTLEGLTDRFLLESKQAFMGAPHSEIPPEKLEEMSPQSWIDGSEPPFLILHGRQDELIPSWKSEEFAAALQEAGVRADLVLLTAGHGFIINPLYDPLVAQALETVEAFLDELASGR